MDKRSFIQKRVRGWLAPFVVPTFIFLFFVAVTFIAWNQELKSQHDQKNRAFSGTLEILQDAITRRADLYINALKGGKGLFVSSDFVSREEWKRYSEALELHNNFPGIQGYGYSEVVTPEERESHITRIRSEGFPDFTIRPEGERDIYTSIIYLEPFDERNRRAFGFDMFSEETRRNAMERARDSGNPATSGRVTLVQEITDDVQAGFLMYIPIYKAGMPAGNPVQRKEAIQGYVYAPFRVNDFLEGLLNGLQVPVDFHLYDSAEQSYEEDSLLYDSFRANNKEQIKSEDTLTGSVTLFVGDRPWTMQVFASKEFINQNTNEVPYFILLGGFVLSFLLAAVYHSIASSRIQAVQYADEVTRKLRDNRDEIAHAKAEDDAILANIGDGLIVFNPKGAVVYTNSACEDLLGWKQSEVEGLHYTQFLILTDKYGEPIPYEERPLSLALAKKQRMASGIRGMYYQKKDSTFIPVEITVSPVFLDGELIALVEVFRDITEQASLDRAKTELVSLASHQLRTPLTTLNWYAELLKSDDGKTLSEEQHEYVEAIHAGAQRMTELVNALLDASRLELGTFVVDPVSTNADKLIREEIKRQKPIAENKKLKLAYKKSGSLVGMEQDPKLLSTIVQNLLSNAIKYTPEKGKVIITASGTTRHLQIEVSDTGLGIPDDQQEHVFEKLFRASNVRKKDTVGTGLGLYVVKTIVDSLGGTIRFTSEEGLGTTFMVRLPRRVKSQTKKSSLT